ncbi:HNH endonuclease, partial [Rathayibacter rathayi]|uniref:HNH endonuclease n=1 Tax=Rathayibacter rathayi TaxID=33887 RepID=UPI003B96893A
MPVRNGRFCSTVLGRILREPTLRAEGPHRDGSRQPRSRSASGAEADHVVEWRNGGGTDPGNLASLC